MSQNILNNSNFLKLLLGQNLPQKKSLLATISQEQTNAIAEIFYNLLHMELSEKSKKIVTKYKSFAKKLADKKLKFKKKKALINKHRIKLIKILMFFKNNLMEILS